MSTALDQKMIDRFARVQTDLEFLRMQTAETDEEREESKGLFLKLMDRMTRQPSQIHN